MKVLSALILALLFSTWAYGAQVRLTNTFNVKVLRTHQFGATFVADDGTQLEVTSDAVFRATGAFNGGSSGRFTFDLPSFGSSTAGYETVSVNYTFDGVTYTDTQTVRVDYSPDLIMINGGTWVRSGGTTFLRATGYFSGRSIDLTYRGRWSAMYGYVFNGNYRAPTLRSGERNRFDTVTFSFGLRQNSVSITVRE